MVLEEDIPKITDFIEYQHSKINNVKSIQDLIDLAEKIKSLQQRDFVPTTLRVDSAWEEIDVEDALQFYEKVWEISFPTYLYNKFQSKWNLTDEFCTHIFNEYAKFLTLIKFTKGGLCPGVWVDELWHTHMECTKLYRDTWITLFGNLIGHNGSDFSECDQLKSSENYQYTLSLYSQIFGQEINENIWRVPNFDNPTNTWIEINLVVLIIQLIGIVNSFDSLRLFEKYRHQSEQELRDELKIEEESEPKTHQMHLHKLKTKRKMHYEQETISGSAFPLFLWPYKAKLK